MKKLFFTIVICITFVNVRANDTVKNDESLFAKNTAIVTYASNNEQERSVKALIKSIRELSGPYQKCKIYVVLGDAENYPCKSLSDENTVLLPLVMEKSFINYPLAIKAFAAAQVEEIVNNEVKTLIWLDPGVLVLNSLDALSLKNGFEVAIRPVTLSNKISLSPGTAPDNYWKPIYRKNKLDYKNLPVIETIVGNTPIQPYYNCEVFSVNPKLGIFKKWAEQMTEFLKDETYQKNVCTTFQQRLFLHQAILSGIISSKVKPQKIKPLPLTSGYPFNQHKNLPPEKKVSTLNELSVIIFDNAWAQNPNWLENLPVNEPLKQWLFDTYTDYLKITDNLYRIEGSCNSYLITTSEGSVLIDPAGANIAPEYFKKILSRNPLKAILLTHAHQDHWDGTELWQQGQVPVIAQREFLKYKDYRNSLLNFFGRRDAIWSRKPFPVSLDVEPFNPPVPTITYADEYTYELGGYHFKMTHCSGETPDYSIICIPELGAVFIGDNYYEYFINNATFRGTLTRPILGYINALNLALSYHPDYFLPGHGTPEVSKDVVNKTVSTFRDALQYIFDETLKGINEGKDVYTLMQEIKVPPQFNIQPYYGKVEWTVRGIYNEYIGWFDENPASMYSVPVSSIYPDIVDVAGAEALVGKAEKLYAEKQYVKVLHLTEIVLKDNAKNIAANELRLKALKALAAGTINYIEKIWLDYGIRICEENLNKK